MPTQEQYYEDMTTNGNFPFVHHGSYQYIPVSEILDGFTLEIEADNDHYLKGSPRYLLSKYAVDGVRELNFRGGGKTLMLELTVDDTLQFVLPRDFVDYLEVFVVGDDRKLYLLEYNSNINIAGSFLQDDEYELVFDDEGDVIRVDGENIYNYPYDRWYYGGDYYDSAYCQNDISSSHYPARNYDTSKFSKHGDFIIDKQRGVMGLSSNLSGKNIVIRYITDGLDQKNLEGEKLEVHKYLIEPLQDYIYMRGIERKRNVPNNEKMSSKRTYKTSRHKASLLLADINPHRIAKAMRSAFKPVKT